MCGYRTYKSEENRQRFEDARSSPSQVAKLARVFFASVNKDCPGWKRSQPHLERSEHGAALDAGYELKVIMDGVLWRPSARRHGYGTWTVGLEEGYHRLDVWMDVLYREV